jgi:tetratricopeptide (TPR) repeat protein
MATAERVRGQPDRALLALKEAGDIQARIVAQNPEVHGLQNELANIHFNRGVTCEAAGRPADALAPYRKARDIQERLVAAHPALVEYRRNLARTLNNLGALHTRLGHPEEALPVLRQAIEHQRDALARDQRLALSRRGFNFHYGALAEALRALGRPAEAVAATLERQKLCAGQPRDLFNVARELALAAPLVGPKAGALSPDEEAERARYLDLALAALRQALEAGFRDADACCKEPAFAPLRGRQEFTELLAGLTAR